jgi:hypothetical protein
VRHFVAVSLVLTLFTGISTLSVFASPLGGHGCAPFIPPAVSGNSIPAPAVSGIIVINEVLLIPHSTWNCTESSGNYSLLSDTWIELYNTQNQPFNLYSAHAEIDSGPNTNYYHTPFGASIAAHGHLVLFPRYDAGFLSTETSTLRLNIGNAVVDQVTVPQLGPDQSYARTSDGASAWQITSAPTIAASNAPVQAAPTVTSPSSGQTGASGDTTHRGQSGNTQTSTSKTLVNGVQPQWSYLQIPTVTPTSDIYSVPTTVITSPPHANNVTDIPRRIALTVLFILLALTILWCWKLFYKTH